MGMNRMAFAVDSDNLYTIRSGVISREPKKPISEYDVIGKNQGYLNDDDEYVLAMLGDAVWRMTRDMFVKLRDVGSIAPSELDGVIYIEYPDYLDTEIELSISNDYFLKEKKRLESWANGTFMCRLMVTTDFKHMYTVEDGVITREPKKRPISQYVGIGVNMGYLNEYDDDWVLMINNNEIYRLRTDAFVKIKDAGRTEPSEFEDVFYVFYPQEMAQELTGSMTQDYFEDDIANEKRYTSKYDTKSDDIPVGAQQIAMDYLGSAISNGDLSVFKDVIDCLYLYGGELHQYKDSWYDTYPNRLHSFCTLVESGILWAREEKDVMNIAVHDMKRFDYIRKIVEICSKQSAGKSSNPFAAAMSKMLGE